MKLSDYYLNVPALAKTPLVGKYFRAPQPLSPKGEPKQEKMAMTFKGFRENNIAGKSMKLPEQEPQTQLPPVKVEQTPAPMGEMQQRKPVKAAAGLYDAAQQVGKVYGIDPANFLANSKWEHRNVPTWEQGKYASNVWWDANRNTGEASFGPYQINMRYFGPEAVKLGRITEDHPLYITPEQAVDPYESTKWQAKKWAREQKAGISDWNRLFQLHNSREEGRGSKVQEIINNSEFVRAE